MDHVNERLARLKHLLGIVEEEQDGLLSTALQAVEDQVLNYLGREELPPELERALLLMTASYWKGAALGGGGTGLFSLSGTGGLLDWRTTLAPFRKLRW